MGSGQLAEDPVVSSQPKPQTFRGTPLAWECATPAEVDDAFEKAMAVGAGLLRRREDRIRRLPGYFCDPDGHVWEGGAGPGFTFTDTGRLILPE